MTCRPNRGSLNFAIFAMFVSCISLLAGGCSGSGSTQPAPNPPPVPAAPDNVRVLAGDGSGSDVQNTISWTLVSGATGYTVYWANGPGVTENSAVLVPTVQGSRYVVHSGVDVVAGTSYYYRVQAASAGGSSALSVERAGTPQQSVTGNQLNDVAWNGVDTLVSVGDSGVILSSPNGLADGWTDVSTPAAPQALSAVTWEDVNTQFLIVGAGSTVLRGDGLGWTREDLSNLPGAVNLEDVAWLDDRYVAVGNNGAILTSNGDGTAWIAQDAGAGVANTALNAVGYNGSRIVVVGTNGTILVSDDAVVWQELAKPLNNDLNDITWDGVQFVIAGSNDTILTSPNGIDWTAHVPGTSDINFVALTQWDAGLPQAPVLAATGSSGTLVLDPDADPGLIVPTGTTEQLRGITWVDGGLLPDYLLIVGNDGTVLTSQLP
jgi:photosystem II stability/assembly factor-like uncharacterized protein